MGKFGWSLPPGCSRLPFEDDFDACCSKCDADLKDEPDRELEDAVEYDCDGLLDYSSVSACGDGKAHEPHHVRDVMDSRPIYVCPSCGHENIR